MKYTVRNVRDRLNWNKIILKMENGKEIWICWDSETSKDEEILNRNLQVSEAEKNGLKNLCTYLLPKPLKSESKKDL